MKRILSIFLSLSVGLIYAQGTINSSFRKVEFITLRPANLEGVKGTPYVHEEFQPASIEGFKGSYLVRYNASDEQMEVKVGSGIKVVPVSSVSSVKIESLRQTYIPLGNDFNNAFGRVVWEDDKGNILLARDVIGFQEEQKAKNGYGSDKPAKYLKSRSTYYLKSKGGLALELPEKKKKFLTVFSDKKEEVAKLIKQRKFKLDKEEDLKQIVSYYYQKQ
ncbi:hypothetical protein [Spongiivirga citrea]|uniref:Uncharacterized protein n=1 Tax=Spongiivirga citrea TaxID=1481457 RepID=A0A6M0CS14_9FLAO|nr:hypothetical protein [Spongiivirga citrea]NER18679.1 hypothetical protein [Spongiivirga citrea]